MTARHQIVAAVVLAAATYGVLLRIAAAKVETSVGGAGWVAPSLGPDRWAVFAEWLQRVRRIYIRRLALLDPRAHLYPVTPAGIPEANQNAFAWISLAGALRHELAHYDGLIEEAEAYAVEIAWCEDLRASPWFASLQGERRRVFDWALESAVLTARRASEKGAHAPRTQ